MMKEEVIDDVYEIIDIANASELKWAAEEISKAADKRHETEKMLMLQQS